MPGPDPQPPTPAPASRSVIGRAIRNGCLWVVLILRTAVAVVLTVRATHGPEEWDALRRAAPRVLADAAVQSLAGLAAALLIYRLAPRLGLWVALTLVAIALYPFAARGQVQGLAWIPFMLLLGLAALDTIPPALHDAAAIDRARGWFKFRTITLPLIAPLLLGGFVFRAVDGFRPADVHSFIAAHQLLILAIAAGVLAARSRR